MYYERNCTNCTNLCEDLHPYKLLLYFLSSKDGNFNILPRNVHRAVRLVMLYFYTQIILNK